MPERETCPGTKAASCGRFMPCPVHRTPANSMLDEIDAGRKLAQALRRYLDVSELGQAHVATPEDEREFKLRALDVYNALNRCEVLMPKAADGGESDEQ